MNVFLAAAQLFHKGGLVMYPLLLCSIFVVAITVERFRCYQEGCRQTAGFFETLRSKLEIADWEGAIKLCKHSPGLIARVLVGGLRFRGDITGMKDSFETLTALEAANLRKHLGYLDTIVTLSPLLGLLGTVLGMIGSFSVLDVNNGNPTAITGGVGEALVATATGLCVAVLALVAHSYFSHRLDNLITDIEKMCAFVIAKANGERV